MTDARTGRFAMTRSTLLEVPHRAGACVASAGGTLWVTLDNDPRDIVLAPGESFRVPPGRRALVYALEDAVLVLGAPASSAARPAESPRRRGWLSHLSLGHVALRHA
jgi:hypothetical protein